MINLIPPEGHREVKREYYLRVGATLALLFAGVAIFLTVALIPTYVLVRAQIEAFALEAKQESDTEGVFESAEGEVKTAMKVLSQLKAVPETVFVSAIIDEIQERTSSSIVLKTFYVDAVGGVIEKIQVQGVADTREALAELKGALESSDTFLSAEVPIADLARDADLPFAITVTLAPRE